MSLICNLGSQFPRVINQWGKDIIDKHFPICMKSCNYSEISLTFYIGNYLDLTMFVFVFTLHLSTLHSFSILLSELDPHEYYSQTTKIVTYLWNVLYSNSIRTCCEFVRMLILLHLNGHIRKDL